MTNNLGGVGESSAVTPQNESSAAEVLQKVLKDANSVIFMEGHVPNAMSKMKVYGLDLPRATREDIDNFVRASGSDEVKEKINLISQKRTEDYPDFGRGQEDVINYSISIAGEFAYRGTYRRSKNGTQLVIRRIPKHTPLGGSQPL
jgi:Tfp pilus assembly ATPase PilU